MNLRIRWLSFFLFLPFILSGGVQAEVSLASVFTDQMIFQRDKPVLVWGAASPNEKITVMFADQTKSAIADRAGYWQVLLDSLSASQIERVLTVEASHSAHQIVRNGILVGDVWLCSGQSNMHFTMKKVANAEAEIAAAAYPQLRYFSVAEQFTQHPASEVSGSWREISAMTVSDCSAVAYYFGRVLHKEKNIPVGLLISSVGGTRIQTWMNPETLATMGEDQKMIDTWKRIGADEFRTIAQGYRTFQNLRDSRNQSTKPPISPKMRCHDCPGALHYGMIAPLQRFSIRGVIWYQGEANSNQPKNYEKLLPALIDDWREAWGEEMPFLFVQLAPFRSTHPAFREAQARIVNRCPRTAIVVTTDVGDANDIHPIRKRPVGERLALAAKALSYGDQIEYSGPVFSSMRVEGNRVFLSFSHVGAGLIAKDGPLRGFTISSTDGIFHPATAVIEGNLVMVTSSRVVSPQHVRLGWDNVPEINFYNADGLPAVPFRTDGE